MTTPTILSELPYHLPERGVRRPAQGESVRGRANTRARQLKMAETAEGQGLTALAKRLLPPFSIGSDVLRSPSTVSLRSRQYGCQEDRQREGQADEPGEGEPYHRACIGVSGQPQ